MLKYINTCLNVLVGIVLAIFVAVVGLMFVLAEPDPADAASAQAVTKSLWQDPPVRPRPVIGGHA